MNKYNKSKPKRLRCEFNNCECKKYVGKRYGQCKTCNHGDVWHKLVHVYQGTILAEEYNASKDIDMPH